MVNERAKEDKNHFFIAKYPATREYTYMLWREGNTLWILDIGDSEPGHWHWAVRRPRSGTMIDLKEGVVPTDEEVGTSTYLVSQPWVDSIVYDAVQNGDLILIEKENRQSTGGNDGSLYVD